MIYLSNDKSEVIESPLLAVLEPEVKKYNNTNNEITEVKFELVEKLLKKANIDEFNLLFPSKQPSNIFLLKCISLSYYLLCD